MIQLVSLRMVRERDVPYGIRRPIGKPAAVAELWFDLHPGGEPDREQVWLVCLDTRNQPTHVSMISQGGLNFSVLSPRDVFSVAVTCQAASVILLHNHPSGDPTPSQDDLSITHRLREAGEMLGIRVLDHVVIGDGCFWSIEEGRRQPLVRYQQPNLKLQGGDFDEESESAVKSEPGCGAAG